MSESANVVGENNVGAKRQMDHDKDSANDDEMSRFSDVSHAISDKVSLEDASRDAGGAFETEIATTNISNIGGMRAGSSPQSGVPGDVLIPKRKNNDERDLIKGIFK